MSKLVGLTLFTMATGGSVTTEIDSVQSQGSKSGKSALLLVDVQDCFLEQNTTNGQPGSLSVPASHIIPLINSIREKKSCLFDTVILTQDFHPANHISFGSTHGLAPFSHLGRKGGLPVKCVKPTSGNTADASCCPTYHLNNMNRSNCGTELCPPPGWNYAVNSSAVIAGNKACTDCKTNPASCLDDTQAMWTDHCLQSGDSTFPPSLRKESTDIVVQKGTNTFVDAYSAFMDNTQNFMTKLDPILRSKGVDTVYVAGIATDVCVHATVRDAFSPKTGTYSMKLIKDATAAVLGNQANFDNAVAEMKSFGAEILTTADVLAMACPASASVNTANTNGGDVSSSGTHSGAHSGVAATQGSELSTVHGNSTSSTAGAPAGPGAESFLSPSSSEASACLRLAIALLVAITAGEPF